MTLAELIEQAKPIGYALGSCIVAVLTVINRFNSMIGKKNAGDPSLREMFAEFNGKLDSVKEDVRSLTATTARTDDVVRVLTVRVSRLEDPDLEDTQLIEKQ